MVPVKKTWMVALTKVMAFTRFCRPFVLERVFRYNEVHLEGQGRFQIPIYPDREPQAQAWGSS